MKQYCLFFTAMRMMACMMMAWMWPVQPRQSRNIYLVICFALRTSFDIGLVYDFPGYLTSILIYRINSLRNLWFQITSASELTTEATRPTGSPIHTGFQCPGGPLHSM